jgi:hypothetical protein
LLGRPLAGSFGAGNKVDTEIRDVHGISIEPSIARLWDFLTIMILISNRYHGAEHASSCVGGHRDNIYRKQYDNYRYPLIELLIRV